MNAPIAHAHPEFKRRVLQELAMIRQRFGESMSPQLDQVVSLNKNTASISIVGNVVVERQTVPVRVRYPYLYPMQPPELWIGAVVPPHCPHVLAIQHRWTKICWIDGGSADTDRRRWDPNRHTAVTAILAAQRWVAAMLVWRQLGTWPVADACELRS